MNYNLLSPFWITTVSALFAKLLKKEELEEEEVVSISIPVTNRTREELITIFQKGQKLLIFKKSKYFK